MTEIFLTKLDKGKISDISDIARQHGLEGETKELGEFASEFSPNIWRRDDLSIRAYREEYPVAITTDHKSLEITKDPYFPIIREVVQLLGCGEVVDSGCAPYDMNIFK